MNSEEINQYRHKINRMNLLIESQQLGLETEILIEQEILENEIEIQEEVGENKD